MSNTSDDYDPVTEFQYDELIYYLTHSPEIHAKTALARTVYACGGVCIGAQLFGLIGILFCGIAGCCMGYSKSVNYHVLVSHLAQLNHIQRKRLLRKVGFLLMAAGATESQLSTPQQYRTTIFRLTLQGQVRLSIWKACLEAADWTPLPPM